MNKLLSTSIALLLTSAVVSTTPTQTIETITPINAVQEVRWMPYNTEWDTCVINGKTYNDVTFTYTELGLAYITGKTVRYEQNMDVTYCETTIEDNDIQ